MEQAKILVVDDEASIRFYLEETLCKDGHEVVSLESGEQAVKRIEYEEFDLALLDLRLPGIDGLKVLDALHRRWPSTSVIVLTAHASLETAVDALRKGASDYLFKPCSTVELRASVGASLAKRRKDQRQRNLLSQLERTLRNHLQDIEAANHDTDLALEMLPEPEEENTERFLRSQGLVVDLIRHVAAYNNKALELSPTEFNLLAYLISESPRVLSPKELVKAVLGYESNPWEARDTARYHICRLRDKLERAGATPALIRTVRGVGYTLGE